MKKIKYLVHYDFNDANPKRNYSLAGSTKVDYLLDQMIKAGYYVEIYSMASIISRKFGFHKGYTVKKDGCSIQYQTEVTGDSIIAKILRNLIRYFTLLYFLLFKIKKDDILLVYHSPTFFRILNFVRRLRDFKLILEAEEIYHDVALYSDSFVNSEEKLLQNADAYFFSTELLNSRVNIQNKDWLVVYGTYNIEPIIVDKYKDGKIHVVYAGTFDPNKGGAVAAAAAGEYLSDKYHLHIIGFGSDEQISLIKNTIKQASKDGKATITYDGMLKGKDYTSFIQKCHIGLSTQNPNAAFNATSFPSKILSYMSNGLSVVSIKIDAITKSNIGEHIQFYEEQDPKIIADSIMSCDIENNNREVLAHISEDFQKEIVRVVESVR